MSANFNDLFERIHSGQMVIIAGEEEEDTEGDLVMAAELVTADRINFMVRYGRGVVSVAIPEQRMHELGIPLLPISHGVDLKEQAGVLIEARKGVTTGISAADRAQTIQTVASLQSGPDDLVMPGHVVPLMALSGGVMMRMGRAEGAVDLVRLAGLRPAAALCSMLAEDGSSARLEHLNAFSAEHSIPICFIKEIVGYRLSNEVLVQRATSADFPLERGQLRAVVFRNIVDGREHLALIKGDVGGGQPALVRLHSECLTGDVFGSARCDCGQQLEESVERILAADTGVLIYLHQEGRGIGLGNKIKAYALQDAGLDTVEANIRLGFKEDLRDYGIGAQILRDLGVGEVHLLTNNPHKLESLTRYGLRVKRVPLEVKPHPGNIDYLRTKKEKLGHLFSALGLSS